MSVIDESAIVGDDATDTELLRGMARKAEAFVRGFRWCRTLHKGNFVDGCGGIFAIFLVHAEIAKMGDDVALWIFVGDTPSAYLESDGFPTPASAMKRYLAGVQEWINAVRANAPMQDLIPIVHPIDDESLNVLEKKLESLSALILPTMYDGTESRQ